MHQPETRAVFSFVQFLSRAGSQRIHHFTRGISFAPSTRPDLNPASMYNIRFFKDFRGLLGKRTRDGKLNFKRQARAVDKCDARKIDDCCFYLMEQGDYKFSEDVLFSIYIVTAMEYRLLFYFYFLSKADCLGLSDNLVE